MSFVLQRKFFLKLKVSSGCVEFMIDKKRFLGIVKLSRNQEWVELMYDSGDKSLRLQMKSKKERMTNFHGIYFTADYGEGFWSRERVFRNVLSLGREEFLNVLECWKKFVCLFWFLKLLVRGQLGRVSIWSFHTE